MNYAHIRETRQSRGHPPYATHPIAVTETLVEWGVTDLVTLIAGLLHDTLEIINLNRRSTMPLRITQAFKLFSDRLLLSLNYLTHYKEKGSFTLPLKNLAAKGSINLQLVKL